jgi:type I restriction enzyme M protein
MNRYINFVKSLGFILQDGDKNLYIKTYNAYTITCDFDKNQINYGDKIITHRATTSNFSQDENLVVLECVDKLLTIGYKPEYIELEKPYGSGRKDKGQFLDILLKRKDNTAFTLIECKTYGFEHTKEMEKMKNSGGQLFNYYANQKDAEFLILYSCNLEDKNDYRSDIINTSNFKTSPDTKTAV